ncbi:MAG: flagellar motor protein MotB [Nitrospirae bacterium]|nr:flagellar motor protein MotB [Nitrospirota bacterium]
MTHRNGERNGWVGQDLADSWLVIFADLLTLLITLFVLMLSMNALKAGMVPPSAKTTGNPGLTTPVWEGDPEAPDDRMVPLDGIGEVGARVAQMRIGLNRDGLTGGFEIYHDRRGMVLRFGGAALLADGRLTRSGALRVERLGAYLARSGQVVAVTAVAGPETGAGWAGAAQAAALVGNALVRAGVAPAQVVPVARGIPYPDPLSTRPSGGIEFILHD